MVNILKASFPNSLNRIITWVVTVRLLSGEGHRTSKMKSYYWLFHWPWSSHQCPYGCPRVSKATLVNVGKLVTEFFKNTVTTKTERHKDSSEFYMIYSISCSTEKRSFALPASLIYCDTHISVYLVTLWNNWYNPIVLCCNDLSQLH